MNRFFLGIALWCGAAAIFVIDAIFTYDQSMAILFGLIFLVLLPFRFYNLFIGIHRGESVHLFILLADLAFGIAFGLRNSMLIHVYATVCIAYLITCVMALLALRRKFPADFKIKDKK